MEKRNQRAVNPVSRFAEVKRRSSLRNPNSISRMSQVREISSLANKAFQRAARMAMEVSGFVVVAENEWVVKKYADGRTERISPIQKVQRPGKLVL